MAAPEEAKLELFLQWLLANGVELRGCDIKYCGPSKGFGVFSSATKSNSNGVLLVVPLDLAITPMRVLQDPNLGPKCGEMFKEGDVDDRFLMMLFLIVERLRKNSLWKPYIDMLPSTFGNPLWFTEDELSELKGTTLYRATILQKKKLQALFDDKVKGLVDVILEGENEVHFKDFLWANSVFWTRALNIPFPWSYVFPSSIEEQESSSCCLSDPGILANPTLGETVEHGNEEKGSGNTVWVEGLVPGIDFCNHGLRAAATWEVDDTGTITGVPCSMYLISAEQSPSEVEKEILISYGNKGNEELLYLYGFVNESNPDDYLMVHYPMEAFQNVPFTDSKARLLEIQKAELRCLLPRSLLDLGFFSGTPIQDTDRNKSPICQVGNYNWSGQRKVPIYSNKLVFPEDFLTALRTIAMQETELVKVSSLLEEVHLSELKEDLEAFKKSITSSANINEKCRGNYQSCNYTILLSTDPHTVVESEKQRQPSDMEVRAAVWEACGDSGALQLLVDLLHAKMMELEDGSGAEVCDTELLGMFHTVDNPEAYARNTAYTCDEKLMSRKRWSSIVYRQGQKMLTRLFLREAEHALDMCLAEEP